MKERRIDNAPFVLGPTLTHFLRTCFLDCVTCQPLFAGLKKDLAPFVTDAKMDSFPAAKIRDNLFAPQSLQNDTDLLLG